MSTAPYLKRAANGTYYVHWTVDRVGKRISTRTADLATAKEFFATWLLMERTAPRNPGAVTIADLWRVYDAEHVQPKVVNKKKAAHAWQLLEPHFGARLVSEVTQKAVDDYVHKRTTGKLGRKVKPQTTLAELSFLIAAINFGAKGGRGLVTASQALDVTKSLTLPAHGEPRDRWLTLEEMQILLDTAAKLRSGDRLSRGERFLWLALETAARKAAIMELTWDRVDFETRTIRYDIPGRLRTKKRRATVSISDALLPILERAYRERIGDLVLDNGGPIWATVQSIVMRSGLAPKQKVASSKKPKATGISPHVLRHTAATQMARAGVPLFDIADVLGNTVAMVEKVYGHHCRERQRAAVNRISQGRLEAAE